MRIDPARVDELLRLIAEKKIDSDDAARSLLGIDSLPDCESMQSLVQRLGPPPAEVEEDWIRQIQLIAKSHQSHENHPLPPLTMADWFVDAENRVSLSPRIARSFEPIPSSATQTAIEPLPEAGSTLESEPTPTSRPTAKRPKTRQQSRNRKLVVAASIATAALILLLVLANSQFNREDISPLANQQTTSPPRDSRSSSPFDPGFIAAPLPAANESVDLQAGVMADAEPPSVQPATIRPPRQDFGFDNPLLSGFATASSRPTAAEISSDADLPGPSNPTDAPPQDRPADTSSDADWDAVAADPSEPEASATIADQPVESATPRQAVTLPTLRSASPSDNSTLVGVNRIRDAQWDFPTQSNIQFALSTSQVQDGSGEPPSRWLWTDATSGAELATLDHVDQQIFFRWSEQAASNPLSRQMAAGRLRLTDSTGQSSTVFLRPHLRTSPLRLDATEIDARFSWPLEGPAIYQTPNLHLQATKHDDVEILWIEPPDPTNIRKQIATLQWTSSGKPSPAIRCRIECKASTKLQMRLRYFAQLDSTFPWQPYSATQLTTALDQVTQLLERRTAELSQLENQYRNATTGERRSIRPLKENVEQSVTQFRLVLQKLQQLNILHSAVAASSHLQLTLTTDWPDGPQTVLEIPLPDK